MINLKQLEQEIDALLASETPESLAKWAESHSPENVQCYLGHGDFVESGIAAILIDVDSVIPTEIIHGEVEDDLAGLAQFAMAA
jgi:hypothetical protein